jgi:hypothetical protein
MDARAGQMLRQIGDWLFFTLHSGTDWHAGLAPMLPAGGPGCQRPDCRGPGAGAGLRWRGRAPAADRLAATDPGPMLANPSARARGLAEVAAW